MDAKGEKELSDPPPFDVQFNPASLKLAYSNNNKGGDQPGGASKQYVGASVSKMQVELFFDTTASGTDVRASTSRLSRFLQAPPASKGGKGDKNRPAPHRVRFSWGSILFTGVIDSMDETLDFFSAEGVPLRATVGLSLSQEGITFIPEMDAAKIPGSQPLTTAQGGDSLQNLAPSDWKSVAAANGIDDPLRLSAGAVLNLQAGAGVSAGFGAGASASVSGGIGASIGGGLSAGAGGGVGFSAGLGGGVGFSAGASASASAGIGASAGVSGGLSAGGGIGGGISGGIGGGIGGGVSAGVGGGIGGGISGGANVRLAGSAGGSSTAKGGVKGKASIKTSGGGW